MSALGNGQVLFEPDGVRVVHGEPAGAVGELHRAGRPVSVTAQARQSPRQRADSDGTMFVSGAAFCTAISSLALTNRAGRR